MDDDIVLITGGGSGIGRDCVLAYACEGVRGIVVADLDYDGALDAVKQSLKLASHKEYEAIAVKVDVSDEHSVQAMVDSTVAKFGRVDCLVNSAGVGVKYPAEVAETSIDELDRFYKVNVRGSLLCLRAVTRVMKDQERRVIKGRNGPREIGRGVMVNIGSCSSFVASPNIVQYTTAKHAVLGMTRNAALDNAQYGIRVLAVCPSWVDTPMIDGATEGTPELRQYIDKVVPFGRIATVEEISDVIVFLTSPKASYMTGVGCIIDGGATLFLFPSDLVHPPGEPDLREWKMLGK